MEIPARMFFVLWALIGAGSLFIGIKTLDKTDLPTSISPVVLSFFKHSLAVFASTSSGHALVVRPKLTSSVGRHYYISFAVFPILFSRSTPPLGCHSISDLVLVSLNLLLWGYFLFEQLLLLLVPNVTMSVLLHFIPKIINYPVLVSIVSLFPILAWTVALKFCGGGRFQKLFFGNERFQKWLFTAASVVANRIMSKKTIRDLGGVIGFPVSLGGAILFQYFFKLTSFDHVLVFLLFAVAWLSNLALLLCPHDVGVFNFLLSNVIVGTTLNQFGLRGTTWLAYGACLLLHGVRVMLQSMSLVKRGDKEVIVRSSPTILPTLAQLSVPTTDVTGRMRYICDKVVVL